MNLIDKLKLRRANSSPSNLSHLKFKKREIGRFEHRDDSEFAEKSEAELIDERQELRRKAMAEATLTERRDVIARKMYHGQGVSMEDWPALQPLSPKERTKLIADVRQIFGLRAIEVVRR